MGMRVLSLEAMYLYQSPLGILWSLGLEQPSVSFLRITSMEGLEMQSRIYQTIFFITLFDAAFSHTVTVLAPLAEW